MKKIFLMLVLICCFAWSVRAQTVVTYWNANPPEDEVLYYNVYYGDDVLSLEGAIETKMCHHVFRGLLSGETYFFAVTATNAVGESKLSEIVLVIIKIESNCPGDFDNDGDVDGADLSVFVADFGRTDCFEAIE